MNMQKDGGLCGAIAPEVVALDSHRFAIEQRNGNISFNLTMMAKPYGKTPKDWRRTDEAQRYLAALSDGLKCPLADLLEVRRGGTPELAGTWASHYLVAVEFARWLDPKFSIVINDLVFKILTRRAVVAEPFRGVPALVVGHRAFYSYLDVLQALNMSRRSGSVAMRKRRYAGQFVKLFGRNFVTLEFCGYLQQTASVRQLRIDFAAGLLVV